MWQPARLMQPRLRVLALYVSKSLTKWAAIQSIITPNSHRAAASFWGLKGRQEDQSGNIFRSPTMPRAEPNRHRSHATVSPAGTNLHIPLSGGIPYIIPTMPLGIPPQAATFEHHAPSYVPGSAITEGYVMQVSLRLLTHDRDSWFICSKFTLGKWPGPGAGY